MGDQPQLPKSLENMVVQEYRKEKARERLRRKMEQKKVSTAFITQNVYSIAEI